MFLYINRTLYITKSTNINRYMHRTKQTKRISTQPKILICLHAIMHGQQHVGSSMHSRPAARKLRLRGGRRRPAGRDLTIATTTLFIFLDETCQPAIASGLYRRPRPASHPPPATHPAVPSPPTSTSNWRRKSYHFRLHHWGLPFLSPPAIYRRLLRKF